MKVTNKGYINFNNEYNKKTDTMMTASMSFANGKDDSGNCDYCRSKRTLDRVINLDDLIAGIF
ncbi:TPA: hypothetical protein U2C79_001043 [Streptococcus suis]|nr:hypothetical protein [Streptococcus suis]